MKVKKYKEYKACAVCGRSITHRLLMLIKQKAYEEGYDKGRQSEFLKTEDKLKMMHCNCHKEYDTNQFIWCSHCEDELDRLEKENIKLKEEVESLKKELEK